MEIGKDIPKAYVVKTKADSEAERKKGKTPAAFACHIQPPSPC
jgi:hypothetical protein